MSCQTLTSQKRFGGQNVAGVVVEGAYVVAGPHQRHVEQSQQHWKPDAERRNEGFRFATGLSDDVVYGNRPVS